MARTNLNILIDSDLKARLKAIADQQNRTRATSLKPNSSESRPRARARKPSRKTGADSTFITAGPGLLWAGSHRRLAGDSDPRNPFLRPAGSSRVLLRSFKVSTPSILTQIAVDTEHPFRDIRTPGAVDARHRDFDPVRDKPRRSGREG